MSRQHATVRIAAASHASTPKWALLYSLSCARKEGDIPLLAALAGNTVIPENHLTELVSARTHPLVLASIASRTSNAETRDELAKMVLNTLADYPELGSPQAVGPHGGTGSQYAEILLNLLEVGLSDEVMERMVEVPWASVTVALATHSRTTSSMLDALVWNSHEPTRRAAVQHHRCSPESAAVAALHAPSPAYRPYPLGPL